MMTLAATPARPRVSLRREISTPMTIPCAHMRLIFRGRPLIMGILNVTPDSFSDGGRFIDPGAALARGIQMAEEGADLIDVGGESTRPGSSGVSAEEELRRILPIVKRLAQAVRLPISVDTTKADVAEQALDAGAVIVNDVSALRHDPGMSAAIAKRRAALILMHMRGSPRTMQQHPRYRDVVNDVASFLIRAAERAQEAGIERSRILIDPGLGFGKTLAHNLKLMASLGRFVELGYPVVIGPSRKSFIGKTLDLDVDDRLAGTLACVAHAARCGVHVVRVHDVKQANHVVRMLEAINHEVATTARGRP